MPLMILRRTRMKRHGVIWITAAFAGLFAAMVPLTRAAESTKEKTKSDLDLLQGKWRLVSGEYDGKAMPPEMIQGLDIRLTVDGDKLTEVFKTHPDKPMRFKVVLDSAKTPKQIDEI